MRTVLMIGLLALTAAAAQAQQPLYPGGNIDPNPPTINPYRDPVAVALCATNMYTGHAACFDSQYPLLADAQVRISIPETLLGHVGREAGYLIVTNNARQQRTVLVELYRIAIDGEVQMDDGTARQITYVYPMTIAALGSKSWDLRADPLFHSAGADVVQPDGERRRVTYIIRAVVHCADVCDAQTITWPAGSTGPGGSWSGDVTKRGAALADIR